MKKNRLYLLVGGVIVLVYFIITLSQPKVIDWTETFENRHKIPFGTRALYEMMGKINHYAPLETVHVPVYNKLEEMYLVNSFDTMTHTVVSGFNIVDPDQRFNSDSGDTGVAHDTASVSKYDSTSRFTTVVYSKAQTDSLIAAAKQQQYHIPDADLFNFVFINRNFNISKEDNRSLLKVVSEGANVFIAADQIPPYILDSLHLKIERSYRFQEKIGFTVGDHKYAISAFNHFLQVYSYVDSVDTTRMTVLGTIDSGKANFVKIKYGSGHFFLNTDPLLFTNYYVLNDTTYSYAFQCLGQLPANKTLWDEYYKSGREGDDSPLRYVLSAPALRLGWIIMWVTIAFFVLLESKRRQKAIAVVKPFTNDSLIFIKSLAGFYFKSSRHGVMAAKKWKFFADFMRLRFNMDIQMDDTELVEKIARRTYYPEDKTYDMIMRARATYNHDRVTEKELLEFNHAVNQFYKFIK